MPNPIMLLGMAIQAFCTSFLMSKELITVNPGQQFIAGIFFFLTAVAV